MFINKRFIFWQGGATFDQINSQVQTQQQAQKASQGMPQADFDKIWGTHTTTSIMPQAPQQAQIKSEDQPAWKQALGTLGNFSDKAAGAVLTSGGSLASGQGLSDIANNFSESTVKPIAKLAATGAGSIIANAKAGYNAIKTGDFSDEGIKKSLSSPMDVPILGNINPNKQDAEGNFSVGRSALDLGGKTIDAASGVANIVAPELTGGKSGLAGAAIAAGRGALQAGAKAVQDPNATPLSVGANAAIGGALSGALSQAPALVKGARNLGAKFSGLSEESLNTLSNPETAQEAVSAIPGAKEAKAAPLDNLDPMQEVAEKHFKPAVLQLAEQNKQLGKQLGDTISNSGVKVDFSQPYQAFENKLNDFGGQFTKDGVQFGEFSKIDEASDIAQLNKVGTLLEKYKEKPTDASNLHALIQKIDGMINYSSKTAVPLSDPAQSILKEVRATASQLLKESVPDSAPLFDQLSKNHEVLDFFSPKLGDNASSTSVLKNLFSSLRKDNALPNLQALEEATGVDIQNPLKAAKTAMNIVGDTRGESLPDVFKEGGIKKQAFETVRRFILNPEKQAKNLAEATLGRSQADKLAPLLSKGNIIPAEIMQALNALFSQQ